MLTTVYILSNKFRSFFTLKDDPGKIVSSKAVH
jgi:hypothetical protein